MTILSRCFALSCSQILRQLMHIQTKLNARTPEGTLTAQSCKSESPLISSQSISLFSPLSLNALNPAGGLYFLVISIIRQLAVFPQEYRKIMSELTEMKDLLYELSVLAEGLEILMIFLTRSFLSLKMMRKRMNPCHRCPSARKLMLQVRELEEVMQLSLLALWKISRWIWPF